MTPFDGIMEREDDIDKADVILLTGGADIGSHIYNERPNPRTYPNPGRDKEEIEIIKPAIKESKEHMLVFGPYSADAFFARGAHEKFDGVLAMYHDQGLIPFKSLAFGEGVNFTAGLPIVRTSPDHGTAFDIAGKNKADAGSFTASIFECVRIIYARQGYHQMRLNPLKKMSARMLAGALDEKLNENEI